MQLDKRSPTELKTSSPMGPGMTSLKGLERSRPTEDQT